MLVNTTELDDLALVRQIQHGDEGAMDDFYRRFASGLYAFIRRRVQEPQDIEDILAETMVAAVSAIMRFKGQSQVFTWLCRIAEYKLADHYRRLNKTPHFSFNEELIATAAPENDLETNLLIWQALLNLNLDHRRVLEAKYFEGYSTQEIAQQLGRSEKAVDSILVRARRAFAIQFRRLAPDMEV